MEGVLKADDLRLGRPVCKLLLCELSDKLERPLVGLGSRVGKEDLAGRVGSRRRLGRQTETSVLLGERDEQVGTGTGPLVVVDVGRVNELFGLVVKNLGDLRGGRIGR